MAVEKLDFLFEATIKTASGGFFVSLEKRRQLKSMANSSQNQQWPNTTVGAFLLDDGVL